MPTINKPMAGFVLVRPILKTKSDSGLLHLPEGTEAPSMDAMPRGEVIRVPEWAPVEAGDIVSFVPRQGYPVKESGEVLVLLKTEHLLAVEGEA